MLISIILNLFQYFIFAVFIYSITGRRFKLSAAISLIPVITTVIETYQSYIWWKVLLLTALPFIISQVILMFLFKDFPFQFQRGERTNKRWIKKDNKKRITPIVYDKKVTIILIVSIVLISSSLLSFSKGEKSRIISIIVLAILTITGLFIRYLILNKYKKETIIIALGTNKDKLYELDITNINKRIMIEDLYVNDIYFADYIGQIDIDETINKRLHIYLISSNDLKEIDQGFSLIDNDEYLKEILSSYTRYNKTHTKVKKDLDTNKYVIVRKRILK